VQRRSRRAALRSRHADAFLAGPCGNNWQWVIVVLLLRRGDHARIISLGHTRMIGANYRFLPMH
jgi:hypothetical protein